MEPGKVIFNRQTKEGSQIMIRYPEASDVKDMWRYMNDLSAEKTYIRYQGEKISREDEEKYVNSLLERLVQNISLQLLVFIDQELVGTSNVDMQDRTDKHRGELGISIAKNFRGKGIGSLLMKATIDEAAKNIPSLEMITLCSFSTNLAGIKLYKKFGFIEYGVLPNGIKLDNGYEDLILMYITVN
jgi:RimJ/RimL family protein N-acetyltransferase